MATAGTTLYSIARKLKRLRLGAATADGAVGKTTLIDSGLIGEPDDFFNGGVIFFLSVTGLTGTTAIVTDFASSTGTLTFAAAGARAVTGTRYAVLEPVYNREMLVSALNDALEEFGSLPQYNVATTTTADTLSYALPAGVYDVKRVEISGDAAATWWLPPFRYWKEVNGYLYFDDQYLPDAGMVIRLTYDGAHAAVYADADVVTDAVHPDLLAWKAVECAARNRTGIAENAEPYTKELMQMARMEVERLRREHPLRRTPKDSRHNPLVRQEIY